MTKSRPMNELTRIFWHSMAIASGGIVTLLLIIVFLSRNLPSLEQLENYDPDLVTRIYSSDGQVLNELFVQKRVFVELEKIPGHIQNAIIASEDRRFTEHWGLSLRSVARALVVNILSLSYRQGFSTLTQQLARNLYEKVGTQRGSASLEQTVASYARKIREQITAVHIERLYTKREILTMYLNTVFFGHGLHGLKLAARYYFDEDVEKLSITQSAVLAGLLKAPNNYSPFSHPEDARKRRNLVLKEMWQLGKIAISQHTRLSKEPIRTRRSRGARTGRRSGRIRHGRKVMTASLRLTLQRLKQNRRMCIRARLKRTACLRASRCLHESENCF